MLGRVLLLIVAIVCSLPATAATRVRSLDASAMLDTDGAAVVNETLTFFTRQHEFVRVIPLRTAGHEDTPLIVRVIKIEDQNGNTLKWHRERDGHELHITVTADASVIRFTYLIPNATRFAGDHDELIWPATDSNLIIEDADFRVYLPHGAEGQFSAQAFLRTSRGTPARVWSSTGEFPVDVEGVNIHTHSPGLLPQGVVPTIGVFLHKGVLTPPNALKRAGWYVGANRIVLFPFMTLVVMLAIRRLRRRSADRTIAASYEPPEGLTAAEVGTIIDDAVDARDVAATLADLAVRGFIRFDALPAHDEHAQPDFKISLVRPREDWDDLAQHERTMLFHTFYGGQWTELSSLRLRFPSIVPWFAQDVMISLRTKGLYTWLHFSPWIVCQIGLAVVAALLLLAQVFGLVTIFDSPLIALTSIVTSAVVVFAVGGKLSSKTRRGRRVWAQVRGFQEFLDRVDADRLTRLTPDLYEKYLPYAMALGVEHGWTAAFDEIAVAQPEWFGADGGLVDPTKFHDTLHAFVTHTLHELRSAKAPRVKLRAQAAQAK